MVIFVVVVVVASVFLSLECCKKKKDRGSGQQRMHASTPNAKEKRKSEKREYRMCIYPFKSLSRQDKVKKKNRKGKTHRFTSHYEIISLAHLLCTNMH